MSAPPPSVCIHSVREYSKTPSDSQDLVQSLDDLLQFLVGNPSELLPGPLNRQGSYLTDFCPRLFGQSRTRQFKRYRKNGWRRRKRKVRVVCSVSAEDIAHTSTALLAGLSLSVALLDKEFLEQTFRPHHVQQKHRITIDSVKYTTRRDDDLPIGRA